jgi:hypothetical protein
MRYIVTPSDLHYGIDIFTYDQSTMRKHVNLGIIDGKNAVQKGKYGNEEKV